MSVFIGYPSFMAYQMMKGKKDNNDGFPTIPGTIARYSASGLTNEQMAANPVWVDKTGNGYDLQLKNFAWGGMSGVGGYEMNFNLWTNNVPSISDISMSKTTTSVSVSVGNSTYNNNLIYIHKNNWDTNKNHWLKITSTYEDGDLAFLFYNDSNTKKIGLPANGYVNILAYPEFKGSYMYISTTSNKQGSFTIEQLPLYPGALVFDGVDDYGVCENFPILNKEKGYTVVALRRFIYDGVDRRYALMTNADPNGIKDGFILELVSPNSNKYTDSFGSNTILSGFEKSVFTYQTSKYYNGAPIKIGEKLAFDKIAVGTRFYPNYDPANVAIWEICILDHDATEEELTKIKNYFVKTYPWLFPYQAWTVVGKTNEDEDRATIANITGNGNNLVLSNFGFIEGSGYNEEGQYAGYLVTDGVDDMITSSAFQMGKDFTIVGDWKFIDNKKSSTGLVKGSSFYIYNTMIGLDLYINSGSVKNSLDGIKSINAACSDGRAYDRNWNEILANTGNVVGSGGVLEVSSSGGRFDLIAFKNLAIYPRILSKDDCIKAYNYLQTLKAK